MKPGASTSPVGARSPGLPIRRHPRLERSLASPGCSELPVDYFHSQHLLTAFPSAVTS
jgi:hypothetical protein